YSAKAQTTASKPVTINVDLSKKSAPLEPAWAYFGYDEPNYTYMTNGQNLLTELSQMTKVPVNIRAHHLLVTGDGTPALKWGSTNAYTEDKDGNPIYNWTIIDRIFDVIVSRKMHPIAQIGFMPQALSTHPDPYYKADGVKYSPKDYKKWSDLVYAWVKHSVERYGQKEVEQWNWELWNEPDITYYWKDSTEDFIKLYDYTADAVKRALPTAIIGGPETTSPSGAKAATFLKTFLTHVVSGKNYATGKIGSPIDLLTFHAKGNTRLVNGIMQMNMRQELRDIDNGFAIIASYPTLNKLPVIIGESDPETCAACVGPQYDYRNGTIYPSYTAASFARIYDMAVKHNINLRGIVTWAFTFENEPIFKGYRELATQGVDKPVLNTFRMFSMMSGNRAEVKQNLAYDVKRILDSGVRAQPDVNALATVDKRQASVMVWNYHDDNNLNVAPTSVELKIAAVPAATATLQQYRIDDEHSNAYSVWKKMGSPSSPTIEQKAILQKAGKLQTMGAPQKIKITGQQAVIKVAMPSHSVALYQLTW
ncbi:MAG: beta-xylosidase, partial [Mucilaginibacter sp.]